MKVAVGFDFALEMLCADDFGRGDDPDVSDFAATVELQERMEEMAHRYNIYANVIRSDDKYSQHQDAYIYFDFDQLSAAKALSEASGLPGDILDLRNDRLSRRQKDHAALFAKEAGWSLGNGWA